MEEWLSVLEMEINNPYQKSHQSEESLMDACFNEELAATLGHDFPYPLSPSLNNTQHNNTSWDFDYDLINQLITSPPFVSNGEDEINQNEDDNNNNNNNNDNNSNDNNLAQEGKNKKEEAKKQTVSGGTKRKRQPSQVQDHIIAERKRRELLGQLFISLSAIVPGLKKTDKTSVLGEAIKYMKQLKEKVKVLEDVVAKRTVESMVVFKKSRLLIDNDSSDDNESSCTMDGHSEQPNEPNRNNGKDYEVDYVNYLLPEIEIKKSGNTILLRVYCENCKGVIAKLFAEIDKHEMSISSCNVIPFESLALDITIVAQMKSGLATNVEDFVKTLRTCLLSSNNQISSCV